MRICEKKLSPALFGLMWWGRENVGFALQNWMFTAPPIFFFLRKKLKFANQNDFECRGVSTYIFSSIWKVNLFRYILSNFSVIYNIYWKQQTMQYFYVVVHYNFRLIFMWICKKKIVQNKYLFLEIMFFSKIIAKISWKSCACLHLSLLKFANSIFAQKLVLLPRHFLKIKLAVKDHRSNSKVFYDDFSWNLHRNVRNNLYSCQISRQVLIEFLPDSAKRGRDLNIARDAGWLRKSLPKKSPT